MSQIAADRTGTPLRPVILAVFAGMALFAMPVTLSSILIAELTSQFGYSSSFGGLLVAGQFSGMILGGLVVSYWAGRVSVARLSLALLALSALFEAASALALEHPVLFLTCRFGTGLGVGAIYTLVLSTVGIGGQSEKVFGLATTLCMAALAAITALAGYLFPTFGIRLGLLCVALVYCLCAPLLWRTPRRPEPSGPKRQAGTPLPNRKLGLCMATGFLLGKMALGLGVAFVIVAANSKGISTQVAGTVVGLALLTGMGGSMLSALLARRISRRAGLSAGLLGATLGWLLLYGQAAVLPTYLAMFIYPFFSAFYATFMLGTAAALDSDGRWASLVSPMTAAGMALGAPLGGWIVTQFTLQHVSVVLAGLLALSLLLFHYVERKLGNTPRISRHCSSDQ
jgi:MFS family permease